MSGGGAAGRLVALAAIVTAASCAPAEESAAPDTTWVGTITTEGNVATGSLVAATSNDYP